MKRNIKELNEIKVNIGCGTVFVDEWVNVDIFAGKLTKLLEYRKIRFFLLKLGLVDKGTAIRGLPKYWVSADLTKKLPFKSNTVNYVFCSHLIEHLEKSNAELLIKEILRILRPNGCVRIVVPNLQFLVEKYQEKDTKYWSTWAGYNSAETAASWLCLAFYYGSPKEKSGRSFGRIIKKLIRGVPEPNSHKWLYDYESLSKLMLNCGFSEIVLQKYKIGVVPDIDKLDRKETEEDSIFVEAKKYLKTPN